MMDVQVSSHEFFAMQVAEAYVLHLMATNRRPVYRYETGDIEVDRHFLAALLDGYLVDRRVPSWRARFYINLLNPNNEPDRRSVFSGGKVPSLRRRGIRYMNALVHEFGDMLVDIGGRDENGRMTMPRDERPDL